MAEGTDMMNQQQFSCGTGRQEHLWKVNASLFSKLQCREGEGNFSGSGELLA